MKKIVVLTGSRRKSGNTVTFVRTILDNLPDEFEIEYIFPQDYTVSPCVGCGTCFENIECIAKDDLCEIQNKILSSDIFVIASPVYLHYMTADLKLVLDKSSWWAHTLRLQGKPVIVLSTCHSNGHKKVTEAVSQIMTYMGGNVIATVNGSQFPNQLNNKAWLESISVEINRRIMKYSKLPHRSNDFLEGLFADTKKNMIEKDESLQEAQLENGEVNYWKETGMINCDSFSEYLLSIN